MFTFNSIELIGIYNNITPINSTLGVKYTNRWVYNRLLNRIDVDLLWFFRVLKKDLMMSLKSMCFRKIHQSSQTKRKLRGVWKKWIVKVQISFIYVLAEKLACDWIFEFFEIIFLYNYFIFFGFFCLFLYFCHFFKISQFLKLPHFLILLHF